MSILNFTKMHGLGNDFVVLSGPLSLEQSEIARLCDRNFGIGADGLLVVSNNDDGVKMEYWNADGSTAEMCGNGLRCVVKYAVENNFVEPGEFVVETAAGKLKAVWDGKNSQEIDVQVGKVSVDERPVSLENESFYLANVGNPHAITFVDDVEKAPVKKLGPIIEVDKYFPNKTNVEFIEIVDTTKINLRIWERGVGETLACGTGMVAAAVTSTQTGKTELPLTVQVPGGEAKVRIDDEGYARIKGPAINVFQGQVNLQDLTR